MSEETPLLTPEEVAKDLRVHIQTVYGWLNADPQILKGTKIAGNIWRIRKDVFATFKGEDTELLRGSK